MVTETGEKIKTSIHAFFFVFAIMLSAVILVGVYRIYEQRQTREPIRLERGVFRLDAKQGEENKEYVASKEGTKYYPVGCATANRIKEENKLYFASVFEAEQAGFERTSTCK